MTAASLTTDDRLAQATQLQLTWWRFRRHRLAVISLVVVALFYVAGIFADFLAGADSPAAGWRRRFVPPQRLTLGGDGALRPPGSRLQRVRGPKTLNVGYTPDP